MGISLKRKHKILLAYASYFPYPSYLLLSTLMPMFTVMNNTTLNNRIDMVDIPLEI